MQKKVSFLFGVTLIALGLLALAGNLIIHAAGNGFLLGFHAWPIFVVGAGLLFCIPPFLYRHNTGLSGLFIPGLPTLATGLILFLASLSGHWGIWARLWPLEVISVALAFILMTWFMRLPWLLIPASILGFTGLALQFCAATGIWGVWAALWTVEPFSVGLPLLVIGIQKKIEGVRLAGIILTGVAVVAFAALSSLLSSLSVVFGLIGPLIVLGLGVYLLVSALLKKKDGEGAPPVS
jgi:hypothetical protein